MKRRLLKNIIFVITLLILKLNFINAQESEPIKEIEAHFLDGQKINLDGKIDEEFWLNIEPISDFIMREPVQGIDPTERTEIRIAIDEKNIYIAAIMYDSDPSGIKASQKKRDASLWTDDRFIWFFDTFKDKRRGYIFEINPAGLRGDGLLSVSQGGGGRRGPPGVNKDWDGIWNVKTHRGTYGWSAEIKIPFQTMNFDPDIDSWGVNFSRTVRRKNEEIIWSGYKRNQGIYRPQNAGTLYGLKDINQGLGIELIPYGIAFANKEVDSETQEKDVQSKINAGFDANYNITPSLKASFTYNTDFAQTDVDDRQINLSRFPLRFPEKRSFFLEGNSILQFAPSSGVDPYFSRRIGLQEGRPIPINFGGRVLGNVGNNNVALLHVRTAGLDTLSAEHFTVARYRRNFLKESSVGLIYTRRTTDDGELLSDPVQNRHTIGADLELNTSEFLGDKVLQFQAFFITHNPESPIGDGTSYYDRSTRGMRINFPNQPWSGSVSYREFGIGYDPAVGFNRRNGFRRIQPSFRYSPLFQKSNIIREMEWGVWFEHLLSLENKLLTQRWRLTLSEIRFESGERIEFGASRTFEFLDEDFDILGDESVTVLPGNYAWWQYEISASSASFRKISGSIRYEAGGFWTGNITETRLRLTLRPFPGINLTTEYSHATVKADGSGFKTNLLQFEMGLDFTPDISLSTNVQYDDVSEVIGTNTRFRWIITPGTDVFLVYNHNWLDNLDYRMFTLRQGVAFKAVYNHRF